MPNSSQSRSVLLFKPSVPKIMMVKKSVPLINPHSNKSAICPTLCSPQDEEPHYCSQLQSTVGAAEVLLARTKARVGQLLHLLQNISQIQKLIKLESLYGTSVSKAARNSHSLKERSSARNRTRSTGAIKLKKSNDGGGSKHTRAMTLDLT